MNHDSVLAQAIPFPKIRATVDKPHANDAGRISARVGCPLSGLASDAIENGLKSFDMRSLTRPFQESTDAGGGFRGEFWGKWALGALSALEASQDDQLAALLEESVLTICATADTDGYLGTYPRSERLSVFDIWNIKYTSWALLEYDRTFTHATARDAALNVLQWLRLALHERKERIESYGLSVLEGAGSLSIVSVLAIYGEAHPELAIFARELIAEARAQEQGILSAILRGEEPAKWPSSKAYELMSVLEGFGEVALQDSNGPDTAAFLRAVDLIQRLEISVIGSGSSQELFARTAIHQTRPLPQPHETCVTTYWMRLCRLALRASGDSKWAEASEVALHNALTGAIVEDGSWWSYFTVLEGRSRPSPQQFQDIHASCCVVNGYRALFDGIRHITEELTDGTVRINSLVDGIFESEDCELLITGSFLTTGRGNVQVNRLHSRALMLRIPSWITDLQVDVNGEAFVPGGSQPSGWLIIERQWQAGDVLHINSTLEPRFVQAPGDATAVAVARGSIIYAGIEEPTLETSPIAWFSPTEPPAAALQDNTALVHVAVNLRPSHYFEWTDETLEMHPFAMLSARSLTDGRPYRVWYPQPWAVPERTVAPALAILSPEPLP